MAAFSKPYIPKSGLDALKNYKYIGGDYSWLDLRLNGFWAWCAEQLPRSMAPNLVTLIGTFHLLAIAGLALQFDPKLQSESPWWVYVLNAWCLWVYQTMDAVDGKQARRTGTSSPLGQLFDHGCDALGTTYIVIGLCSIMGFGATYGSLACMYTVQIPFYLAQWEENHVHVLRAQVGNFGVTEGQYLSIGLNLSRAILGPTFWKLNIAEFLVFINASSMLEYVGSFGSIEIRHVAILIGGFFPLLLGSSCIISVARCKTNFLRAVLLLLPAILQQGFLLYVSVQTPAKDVFQKHPTLGLIASGLLFSHLCNRIIVASVCHLEFPWLHKILFPIPFIVGHLASTNNVEQATQILGFYVALIFIQYFHFVVVVTRDICKHLNIYCLTIKRKE